MKELFPQMISFLPAGFILLVLIAVNNKLNKRPSWDDLDRKLKEKKDTNVCDEIHKSVDEKLKCIPIIKDTVARLETKIDIIIKNNGK